MIVFYGATYAVEDVLCEAASVFRDPLSDPEAIAEFAVEVAEAIRPFYDHVDLPAAKVCQRFEGRPMKYDDFAIVNVQLAKCLEMFWLLNGTE